jgi:hypothetical protein
LGKEKIMTKTVKLPAQEIPVAFETEVLVVGGGSAGVGAALGAARNGAKTLLIEQRNHLGGLATGGLVSVYMNSNRAVHGGVYNEITAKLFERDAIYEHTHQSMAYDKEEYKWLLQNLLVDAGVKVLFRVRCTDALVENGMITGVVIDTIAGKKALKAKIVIDCTRVSAVAQMAGAELFFPETPQSSLMQYVLRNIDYGRLIALMNEDEDYINDPQNHTVAPRGHDGVGFWQWAFLGGQKRLRAAQERGELKFDKHEIYHFGMLDSGLDRIRMLPWLSAENPGIINPFNLETKEYDVEGISQLEIDMREHSWAEYEYLKKNVPGFQNAAMDITADEVGFFGIRIVGDYAIPLEDMFVGKEYDDSVEIASWILDIPDGKRFDTTLHDIPYRCLYSKNINNLMMGGYHISSEPAPSSTLADQPTCISTGQSAGTAAAIAVKDNVSARDVDVPKLQDILLKQGSKVSTKHLPKEVLQEYEDELNWMRAEMQKRPNERLY